MCCVEKKKKKKKKGRGGGGGVTIDTNSTNYLVDILSSQGLFFLVDSVGQLKTPIGHHHFVTTTIPKVSWGQNFAKSRPEKYDFNLYKGFIFYGKKWLKFIKI